MASAPPTAPTTSIKPNEYAKEGILGTINALEERFGCTPLNNTATTLNTKFNVLPNQLPPAGVRRFSRWFAWGNNGRQNDSDTLSSARPVLGTNMSPYSMRPFRAVTLEEDLSAPERANYALREVRPINGTMYVLYWLKKIEFSQSQVQLIRTDPVTGNTSTYEINPENLNPTPPVEDDNGIITDVSDQVSVMLPGVISITGKEVLEAVSVLDGGNPSMAVVSEIALVSAAAVNVPAVDVNGNQFTYEEAIFAQMMDHFTMVGTSLSGPGDTLDRTVAFSVKNLINQS